MFRKGIRRDLLLILGLVVDELDYMSFSRSYRRALFRDYKKDSVYGAVHKLLTVGDIEKIQKRGVPYLRLTSKGTRRLVEDVPVASLAKKRWDGQWRIVVFDIQERRRTLRNQFRKKLLSLGFGQWQKSVYITHLDVAHEVNQFLESKKLTPFCEVLVASRIGGGDDRHLAQTVWKLDELGDRYADFIDRCQLVIKELREEKVSEKEIADVWNEYKQLLFDDPNLPPELLPDYWPAGEAQNLFTQICSNLGRSSHVRIDRVMRE